METYRRYDFLMEFIEEAKKIVENWNQCHDAAYRVDAADLNWHLHKQNWVDYQVSNFDGVPALLAVASAEGRSKGIPGENLWLSLAGEIERPELFFSELLSFARAKGKNKIYLGGEEFHWVSGLPEKDAEQFHTLLSGLGFQFSDVVDYGGSIADSKIPSYIESAKNSTWNQWSLAPVEDSQSMSELEGFLVKEFPGRWSREYAFWRAREDTKCARWFCLRHEKESGIRGFARLSMRGKESGNWFPAALRMPLSTGKSENDSCLGPIGMAAAERGKGNGRVLLAKSLEYLLGKNAQTLCIDWTNAYNYYTPLGLPVVRKYRSAWKVF